MDTTTLWTDDVWVVDSTPVECGRSKETVRRSELAGWASTATAPRIPISSGDYACTWYALSAGCYRVCPRWREGRRTPDTARCPLIADPSLAAERPGQTLIGDKNYFGAEFEAIIATEGLDLLRPTRSGEAERPGTRLFKPLRQTIESINQTFEGQLDLERHAGRTTTKPAFPLTDP